MQRDWARNWGYVFAANELEALRERQWIHAARSGPDGGGFRPIVSAWIDRMEGI
jgi:hypothetical protein